MQREFWEQRWQDNQTGFHLDQVNPYLRDYWSALNADNNAHIFVPLCGKSLDLLWFVQQGYRVTAIECSEIAVKAFFAEQGIDYALSEHGPFRVYQSAGLRIYQGDYFKLEAPMLEDITQVYDRAALVAMPQPMQQAYAAKMIDLFPASVSMLLVALEYDQSLMAGPPFSLIQDDITALYKQHFTIERLHQQDIIQQQPRFRARGLDSMIESVYKLTRP
ncbi:MAG: thiopurine S-methyltransferase [Gammaproteobacteria bacterium]|nr:thiopurine S-methyltransferase [Gammaproteobacteria bacterium]